MRPEYTERLRKNYPALYGQGSENSPANYYGFECGDGWYHIINALSIVLSNPTEYNPPTEGDMAVPIATQVKEKFGGLRFYIRWPSQPSPGRLHQVYGAIELAEVLAVNTCEFCGNTETAERAPVRGWIKCLCNDCHATKLKEDQK